MHGCPAGRISFNNPMDGMPCTIRAGLDGIMEQSNALPAGKFRRIALGAGYDSVRIGGEPGLQVG